MRPGSKQRKRKREPLVPFQAISAVVALEVFKVQGQTQPELILYVLHASERAETRGLRLFRHAIAHVMYVCGHQLSSKTPFDASHVAFATCDLRAGAAATLCTDCLEARD